jgi:predicted transposase/invertase (TIGR01784 family)
MNQQNPPFLSPLIDYIFKWIFGRQENIAILSAFLKTIPTLPGDELDHLTLADPFLRRFNWKAKEGILDILAHTKLGRSINVELQVLAKKDFRERLIFYLARMLGDQARRGKDFTILKPVVSVVICNHELLPGEPGYAHVIEFRDRATNTLFTELLKLVILELPKVPVEEAGTGERVWPWLKFFKCEMREEFEMLAMRHPEVRGAVAVLERLSLSQRFRMRAEAREKWRWDRAAEIAYGHDQGVAEGRVEGLTQGLVQGRAEGLAQGKAEGLTLGLVQGRTEGLAQGLVQGKTEGLAEARLETARRLKARGHPVDEIAEDTGLSRAEIAGL